MKNVIIICVLSFLLGVLSAMVFTQHFNKNDVSDKTETRIDTVFEVLPSEPVILEKVKTKIVYTRDTIIKTQPFIASIDTVLKHDTISAQYGFPENLFSMYYKPASDTLKTVMIRTKLNNNKSKWWEGPAYALAGVVAGYLIRKYSEK